MRLQCAMMLAILTARAAVAAEPDLAAGVPLPAQWVYSVDGGKSFTAAAPTIGGSSSPSGQPRDAAKTEFTVADPAKVGVLKITTKTGQRRFCPDRCQQRGSLQHRRRARDAGDEDRA